MTSLRKRMLDELRLRNLSEGRVCTAALSWPATRDPILGPLHAPRGHLQWPPDQPARGPGDIPVEGFRRREPAKADDYRCGEFIRRFLLHVSPGGFVKIRHFGFLANRNRREALALCRTLFRETGQQHAAADLQLPAPERKCPACKIGIVRVIERIPAAALTHRPLSLANFNTS